MQHALATIQVLDEFGDPAVVLELGAFGLARLLVGGALVGEGDEQPLVQESHLAQALGQRVVVVFRGGEDLLVGQEVDLGSALFRGTRLLQLRSWFALGVGLLPHRAFAPDLEFQQMTERINA